MPFEQMRRREFFGVLGGAAAACPVAARAQQMAMPVIGLLHGVSAASWADRMAGFHRGLAETSFIEGRNVAIEYRWAEGQFERLSSMAADLVSRRVAVLFANPDVGVQAAMAATRTIPIVFHTGSDPVAAGFVSSLAHPGGNVTGVTFMGIELIGKRLQLLRDLVPGASRIAVLVNPSNSGVAQNTIERSQAAARRLGLEMVVLKAATENEIESAISTAVQQQAAALSIATDAYFLSRSRQIAFLALRHALPTVGSTREYVTAGILMTYGNNQTDSYRQAGVYVGRILKGDKPASLPVIQPTKFELLINLTTAKAIGLKIPDNLLARADEVIE
jgi:putative ABC transport system substrate-binding protein